MNINDTLNERAKTHGNFENGAEISQSLCNRMRATKNWHELNYDQIEALEMIAHKIARILNGNYDSHDHWHDIAGYATLVANRLNIPCCSNGDDIDCQQGRNCPRAMLCDK